eukprot:CFRG4870T1
MQPVDIVTAAPAKRLVLFVGDGLRADKAYGLGPEGAPLSPFLLKQANTVGRWGVSRTRVPTESRPGHVAMIAGFYEDVSAVTKGWKENPVEFDSVFNQSRYTFGWGSPDIVPMFTYGPGLEDGHVVSHTYPADLEEFGGTEDASKLDVWVFDRVRETMERAAVDPKLSELLHSDKVVLFLHLLGIDTNGHTHRPFSQEYLDNIRLVDDGIKRISREIEDFYGHDGQTAFVFTADHGMSNRGSHGGGHPDETETPIVCWGAGIAGNENETGDNSTQSNDMDFYGLLQSSRRIDIEQADVAPLMASLINVPFPMNSVGKLPIDFLSVSNAHKAKALYANAVQMLRVVQTAARDRAYTSLFFKPFNGYNLNSNADSGMATPIISMDDYIARIDELLATKQYQLALDTTDQFIAILRDAYRYFQTYDRLFLQSLIVISYAGWLSLVTMFIVYHYTPVCVIRRTQKVKQLTTATYTFVTYVESIAHRTQLVERYCSAMAAAASFMILYQHLPYHFMLYAVLPFLFWGLVITHYDILLDIRLYLNQEKRWLETIVVALVIFLGLESLVAVFFYRWMLSPIHLVVGLLSPYASSLQSLFRQRYAKKKSDELDGAVNQVNSSAIPYKRKLILLTWACMCFVDAIFPLLPVEKHSDPYLIIGMGLVLGVGLGVWANTTTNPDVTAKAKLLLYIEAVILLISLCILYHSTLLLQTKQIVPLMNRMWTWMTIPYALLVPLVVRNEKCVTVKIATVCGGFSAPFFMLSISYETAFYTCLCVTMLLWLSIEEMNADEAIIRGTPSVGECTTVSADENANVNGTTGRKFEKNALPFKCAGRTGEDTISLGDLHVAFFYLYFLLYGFFAMGNIASVSSFDPSSCYRFMTVFSPFAMGALMIGKVLIPEVVVSCTLRGINAARQVPSTALFLVVVAMADVLSINFFFLVRDEGSWLEIGTSISHFVINSAVIIFLPVFNLIGDFYTRSSGHTGGSSHKTSLD